MEPQNPQNPQSPQIPQVPQQPQAPTTTSDAPDTPQPAATSTTQNPFARGNSFSRRRGINGIGSVMPQQTPIAGGVALPSPSSKSQRKRWPIIAGAIIGILIVVVLVFLLITNNGIGGKIVDLASVRSSLNKFGNYILQGQDNDSELDTSKQNRIYKYISIQYPKNEQETSEDIAKRVSEYYTLARTHYDSFEAIAKEYFKDNSEAQEHIESMRDNFYLLYNLATTPELSDNEIIAQYYSVGHLNTITFIDQYYDSYKNSGELSARMASALTERANIIVQLYKIYEDGGCILNQNSIDIECKGLLDYSSYDASRHSELNAAIATTKSSAQKHLLIEIQRLSELLSGDGGGK